MAPYGQEGIYKDAAAKAAAAQEKAEHKTVMLSLQAG